MPSERVLATQYGVSRNVIREAIKILTEKNWLRI
ncbi:GntR family transcriptional regulator [Roseburia amylophila]